MKKLKAAIMGCGRISVCYEDAFRRLSDHVELICAIDTDLEKAKAFAQKFIINNPYCIVGCRIYADNFIYITRMNTKETLNILKSVF